MDVIWTSLLLMDVANARFSRSEIIELNLGVFRGIRIIINAHEVPFADHPNSGANRGTYHGDDGELVEQFRDPCQLMLEVVHPHVADVRALERLMLQDSELVRIVTREEWRLRWH